MLTDVVKSENHIKANVLHFRFFSIFCDNIEAEQKQSLLHAEYDDNQGKSSVENVKTTE